VTDTIRVAILDDHQSIVDGYLLRLGSSPGIAVVATARYGDELEPMLAGHPVDVLLLDVSVPASADNPNPYPILHVIPRLLEHYPALSVLVISMHAQRVLIRAVMEAGASGYILKEDAAMIRDLAGIVRSVAGGGICLSQSAYQQLAGREPAADGQTLTPRQSEVLAMAAAYPDASSAELAERLHLANSTVRNLLSTAYLRLGVRSRAAAVARARQLGLITPADPEPLAARS
jgi:two-component system response regulator DesR